jgi:hypothetical protein
MVHTRLDVHISAEVGQCEHEVRWQVFVSISRVACHIYRPSLARPIRQYLKIVVATLSAHKIWLHQRINISSVVQDRC